MTRFNNAAGQLSSTVLPSGATIAYGYNTNGQVTSLTLNGSTTILSSITYDPFGPITSWSWSWGNGSAANRAFDTDGKVTQVDNASGASLKNYTYDDAFRITGISDAGNSALSWTYGYDALDRLNSATKTGTTQGWTYDANGNRLTQTGTTPSTYTNSSTSNRVSSVTGSLARTYLYDNTGNTLSYAGATFTYNNRGRMASASNGGVTATYTYNALGQRIKRIASGITTLFAYDEAGHLAGEYTSTGALIQETVWLGDTPVATLRANGSGGVIVYYVHADHLNTPRLVTDTSNNVRWRWDSDPFGNTAPNENPSGLGVFVYNMRFPGQQFDAVVGLNYNYFRDYDPASGRYVESDPIGLKGGINTYAYVEGSPVDSMDPEALAKFRWRTCNAAEVSFCKSWCPSVIGRPFQSCRARVGFRLNIETIDYYNLPNGLSCSCQPPPEEPVPAPAEACGTNCKRGLATVGAGVLAYVVIKKCIGAGMLLTPAAPAGVALLVTP